MTQTPQQNPADALITEKPDQPNFKIINPKTYKKHYKKGIKAGDPLAAYPHLDQLFMKHLKLTVKYDWHIKRLVFLTGISASLKHPINLFLKGDSSTGKTYNVTEALKYFPKKQKWMLGGLSPKALVHDRGKLKDENNEEIDLTEKPHKPKKTYYDNTQHYQQALQEYHEQKEQWIERLKHSYYEINLTGKILVFLEAPNIDTFNTLRPILSHDTHEIQFKIAGKSKKGQHRTKNVIIKGYPATIFCTTDEKYVEDLHTRSFTSSPEVQDKKITAANKLTGRKAALPWEYEENLTQDLETLKSYITSLQKTAENIQPITPFGQKFGEKFSHQLSRSMRDCKHLLRLIKAHTLLLYGQRPTLKTNNHRKYILATREDYEYIMQLWEKIRETTETGAKEKQIKFYHQILKPLSQKQEKIHYKDLARKWNQTYNDRVSTPTIRKWVNYLCTIGYADTYKDPDDKRRKLVEPITQKKIGDYEVLEFTDIFDKEMLRETVRSLREISPTGEVYMHQSLTSNNNQEEEVSKDKDNYISIDTIFRIFYSIPTRYSPKFLSPYTLPRGNISSVNFWTVNKEKTVLKSDNINPPYSPISLEVSRRLKGFLPCKGVVELKTTISDTCAGCGDEAVMEFQVNQVGGEWCLLCGKCGRVLKEMNQG